MLNTPLAQAERAQAAIKTGASKTRSSLLPATQHRGGCAWRSKLFRAARRRCRGPVRHLQNTEISQPSTLVQPDRKKMAPMPTRDMSASASCCLIVIVAVLAVLAVLVLPHLARRWSARRLPA